MNEAYTYSDVLIQPRYSEIRSRSADVDLSTKVGKVVLKFPVISANMKNVTGPKMAGTLSTYGGLGLLHRFCSIEDNVKMFVDANTKYTPTGVSVPIGVSIGVKDEEKARFDALYNAGAKIFCIDVAHGHHILVKEMISWINKQFLYGDRSGRSHVTIIAGNVATGDGYTDLAQCGVDAIKVGIGPSPVCRTRYTTGVGVPQLYALEQVYEASTHFGNPPSIIADGGISHPGDISKALKFADVVMLGSMIAGTSETPGDVFRNEDGDLYKVYGGSASAENKGSNQFVEGVIKTVKFQGHVKYIFEEIKQGLESAFSYVGAHNHTEFQQKCEFVKISAGAQKESKI